LGKSRRGFVRTERPVVASGRKVISRTFRSGERAGLYWVRQSSDRACGAPPLNPDTLMLTWALICALIAMIAATLGFTGLAGAAAAVAKFLFVAFLALFVIFLGRVFELHENDQLIDSQ
jgi:uncharacterized membrane protein YtjA (UPF0391 family)